MEFFHVVSEKDALDIIDEVAEGCKLGVEVIGLGQASGRVLAEDIVATEAVPAFNRSTVDGFAVVSTDTHGATVAIPALLDKVGIIEMGQVVTESIAGLQTMYVPTGGMLPEGADAVVMIEDTEALDEETMAIYRAVTAGDNVIHRGDDIREGATALKKGRQLTAVDIGVLAALGIWEVTVTAPMKVTILSTGDEIVPVSDKANLGQIYDINGNVLGQMCRDLGLEVVNQAIVRDDYEALFEAVKKGTDSSDLVILSGGSSVGTRDYTYDVISNLENSEMLLKGVAVKPGKPTILGTGNGSIIFGLPGHPVSSIMIFKLFVAPMIEKISGCNSRKNTFEGRLTENVHGAPGRTTYQTVEVTETDAGLEVTPLYGRSGMITLLAGAQGYIRIPAETEGIEKGEIITGIYL